MEEIVAVRGINKKITLSPELTIDFLRDVNFVVNRGELIALIGESGSGKSTLLHIILGYDKNVEGEVVIHNVNINDMSEIELHELRNKKIGICISDKVPIILSLTVEENIITRIKCFSEKDIDKKTKEILTIFKLEAIAKQTVKDITSTDLCRLALALAFCGPPEIIIIDEILDYLSIEDREELFEIMLLLQKKFNITILLVTHTLALMKKVDRVLCIKDLTIYKVDMERLISIDNKEY